jgi:hypothetical protein
MFKVLPFEPKPLSWWVTQKKNIDMSPTYQRRGNIWSEVDKAYLIDTILNDYDIPKIYIADFSFFTAKKLNQKKRKYAIIDGKQRFEAVFDFLDNKVVMNDGFRFEENSKLKLEGLSYSDLQANHPELAEKIETYSFTVMRVVTDDESKINEMFVRLNHSKPLTGAEIRNAMVGEVPAISRATAFHSFFVRCIRFKVKRGADLNTATKLLSFEFFGKPVDTKRKQLDELVHVWQSAPKAKKDRARDRLVINLDAMAEVFIDKDPLLGSEGIVPVFYWLIRSVDRAKLKLVREFLVKFYRELDENNLKIKAEKKDIDPDLAAYQAASRSTNDQGSFKTRTEILKRWFSDYCRGTAS